MRVALLRRDPRRQRLRTHAHHDRRHARFAGAEIGRGETEVGLAGADQLDIDLGQQLGVEQRAVLDPLRVVDLVARAEIVEPVRAAGMLAPRQHQRIDQPLAGHRGFLDALELGVEEAEIEHRVVRDQRRVAEELDQLLDLVREQRLVLEEVDAEPVHLEGGLRHVAFRIEVAVERLAGRKAIDQLDAADLDQPIALDGIEAGGFGVEHDLAHWNLASGASESFSPASAS